MTTTKNPVSKKSGIIALSCALLALMLLSGCTSSEEKAKAINALAESCRKEGGSANIKVSTNNLGYIIPSFVDVTCSIPPSSESGAKK